MKKILSFLFLITSIALPQAAQAGRIEPESVN